jgi:anti-sigma factor ChrR (cupin superfamily)
VLDRSERLVIETGKLPWTASPAEGVWRRPLEREAAESGETTSVVRFDAGAGFDRHTHHRGEELLVLEGVFEDEHGRYPAGTYLRSPAGSSHAPRCPQGCRIFVKLEQFQPGDADTVCIDTNTRPWLPGQVPGLTVMPLHSFGTEHTALVKWAPGTRFAPHSHPDGEEIFVIDGVFQDEYGDYPTGTWLRNPPGSRHHPFSETGCLILVKVGHCLSTTE